MDFSDQYTIRKPLSCFTKLSEKINVTPFYLGDIGPWIGSIRSKIEKFENTEILDIRFFYQIFDFFRGPLHRYRLWKHRYSKLYLRIFGSPVSFRMKECPLFLLGEMTLQKIRILGRTLEINDFSTKKNHQFLRRLSQLLISLFTTVSPLGETVSLPARAGNFLKTVSPFRAPPSGSRGFGVQNSLQQDDNCHWFSSISCSKRCEFSSSVCYSGHFVSSSCETCTENATIPRMFYDY